MPCQDYRQRPGSQAFGEKVTMSLPVFQSGPAWAAARLLYNLSLLTAAVKKLAYKNCSDRHYGTTSRLFSFPVVFPALRVLNLAWEMMLQKPLQNRRFRVRPGEAGLKTTSLLLATEVLENRSSSSYLFHPSGRPMARDRCSRLGRRCQAPEEDPRGDQPLSISRPSMLSDSI